MNNTSRTPIVLFWLYIILFIGLAIKPHHRGVWLVENLAIVPIVALLAILYKRGVRFSTLAYVMMSFLIFLHTIGGHFTFERVPFDFLTNLFGFERNNYDRFAHFSVGFYAFAIIELLDNYKVIRVTAVRYLFPLFAIMALAAAYEVFEWWYAVLSDPAAGIAVLGSQGDIWDAQKDILCDTSGAVVALILYAFLREKIYPKPSE